MTIINTDLTTTFFHVANSLLHVSRLGSISVDNGDGINVSHDSGGIIRIDGSVSASDNGLLIGNSSALADFDIIIGQTGTITADDFGIRLLRENANIINNGEIFGAEAGIISAGGVETSTLLNTGIISTFNAASAAVDYGGSDDSVLGTFTIVNSGTIQNGQPSGEAIQIDSEDVNLTNSGLIQSANVAIEVEANANDTNSVLINNLETGVIDAGDNAIFLVDGIANAFITNHGQILARDHGLFLSMATASGIDPDVLLINTGIISTVEAEAIDINNSSFRIINSGEILTLDDGVIIGDGQANSSSNASVNNTGLIFGFANAIQLDGYNTIRISNAGEITSDNDALSLETSGGNLANDIIVENSGLIVAEDEAIQFEGDTVRLDNSATGIISAIQAVQVASVSESFTFTNSGSVNGTITGASNTTRTDFIQNTSTGVIAGNISLGAGVDRIVNQGEIIGDITLSFGDEADIINNAGSIIGNIFFGDGDNRLISSGEIDGSVFLSDGNDLIQISGVVTGDFFGGAGNDRLFLTGEVQGEIFMGAGNDFANLLNGNVTRASGGLGDDIYLVNQASDVLVILEEFGEGIDLVRSTISYRLSANVEDLQLVGAGQLSSTGNELDNVLTGNSENNQLEGLDGNDTLAGAGGNDTLLGGNGDDTFQDPLGNNILFGGNDNDTMTTGIGNDKLFGEAGDDLIFAGDGNDILDGGIGFDRLNGGGGADVFDFNSIQDSLTSQADRILDFESGIDSIDLSDIFGGGFADFIGTDSFSAQGVAEVAYAQVGTRVEVYVDANGDGVNDMTIFLLNTMSVEESDFILFESNAIA